jgi:hypothetical protein
VDIAAGEPHAQPVIQIWQSLVYAWSRRLQLIDRHRPVMVTSASISRGVTASGIWE